MAEFTQTMSGDSRYSIKLTVTEVVPSDYVTTNKTNVNYTLTATKSSGSGYWYNSATNPVKVTINGTEVVNTNVAYDFRNSTPKTITLASGTVTGIEHNADGSKTIAVSGYFKDNGNSLGSATASGNLTLTTIPRASQPSVQDVYGDLGDTFTINTNRASNSFTHTINIKVGSTTVETFTNVGASKSWTPTIATYAPYRTDGQFLIATVECITFNGGTNLGTKSTSVQLFIPNNSTTKPTASISIAKGDNVVPAAWGVYVKGKSKLAVTITGTPKFSTTIASYSSTANGSNYNTSSYTTNELTSAGTFNVTATVTDKRGFTSSQATSSYTVQDYSNPQITTAQVYRCDSNGNQDDSGTYIKYIFGGTISSVSNKNSKTFTLKWKPKNGSDTTVGTWTDSYTCSKNGILSGFSTSTEYIFTFTATDSFTTTSVSKEIGTEPDMMNFNASGKSMAIGGVSQRSSGESVIDKYINTVFHKETYVSSIRSKNIFDGLLEQGGFSTAGEKHPDAGMYRNANKIAVQPNTKYTTSINGVAQQYVMFYYASDGSFISSGDNRTGTFTTPNNCYYVNFRCYVADYRSDFAILKVQMEFGEIATSYSLYQELNPDNFKNEEIVVGKIRSKNIFDKNNGIYKSASVNSTSVLSNGIRITCANVSTGVYAAYRIGKYSDFYGKTITANTIAKPNSSRKVGLMIWAETGGSITALSEVEGTGTNLTLTNTYTFNNSTYNNYNVLISLYAKLGSGSVTTSDYTDFTELQVETGSSATTYYPYQELNYKPVTLFSNSSGLFDDITLSDSKTNYSKLEIFYLDDQNFQNCMIVDTSDNPFQLQFLKSGANRGSMYLIATRMFWNSNTVLKRGVTTVYNIVNGTVTENTTADVLKIIKIIAYK